MDYSLLEHFQTSLEHSFIDRSRDYNDLYKAKLLMNQESEQSFVLNEIIDELSTCKEFFFAVAFVTENGIQPLKTVLSDLANKGICGRMITSNYLYFNSPKSFKELTKLKNIDIRITDMEGFHAKGYYFEHDTHESLILGSSNLTIKALKVNCEWNLKLNSLVNGDLTRSVKHSFEEMWANSIDLTETWIKKYEDSYKPIVITRKIDGSENPFLSEKALEFASESEDYADYQVGEITPNDMQKQALREIQKVRNEGKQKALVVSATGTGKTYLSAFDVKSFAPKRLLFVVHREQILTKAMSDYQNVLSESEENFGILSGNRKIQDEKYVFATIQTLSKDETLQNFAKDTFDYILIDEVHRAGANSYQKIIDYFEPEFFLGMTATPERTDGFNIYELFDYNIAYEIRLQEALKEKMLCPFYYFGITDLQIDGYSIDDKSEFSQLVSEERTNYIFEKLEYYGHCGDQVKGLIFCSGKNEASELEQIFNANGFRTKALVGDHTINEREETVRQLENGMLDYIITVDIFNEGIDIPCINQVVMLRKTQSSIIFIQQLGRGLRKFEDKDFVTIIDFIGNYDNNYLIPIALTGDNSLNRIDLRKKTMGTKYLSGLSTISFDEISKNRIFQSIEESNLNTAKNYKEAYQNLKNKIGRLPKLIDFIANDTVDPLFISSYKENYPGFLVWMKEDIPELSKLENQILTFLSKELINGKRNHELLLLNTLINQKAISITEYTSLLKNYSYPIDEDILNSVMRILSLDFFVSNDQKKYGDQPLVLLENTYYRLSENFVEALKMNQWFYDNVKDIIETSFERSHRYKLENALTYNEVYTRQDVCRLLNWENDEKGTMYGYRIKYNTCPIFINYHKDDSIENSVKYEDELINRHTLLWYTKANRTRESKDVKLIEDYKESGLAIHVFVQKEAKQSSEFVYLGRGFPKLDTVKQQVVEDKNGKDTDIVSIEMNLEQPVPIETYDFIKQK
ncbi:DEAD/DEAH box helicase [Enterococcus sp. BWB1-3]|uniref:DEAD/DEAH box helicase n=1 Tax=Enterococcus sp. BWB1-3 TaxID=2787713 RepID=UPI0019250C67|nr:DEAD/DEAH box helicase [Enterococcus sp. BWB1-3]MBL1230243.1 DEAD/DEAH box helicase [Enterococcus sp. BWB1-3]